MVRVIGLEPTRPKAPEPKSGASTNFATPALHLINNSKNLILNKTKKELIKLTPTCDLGGIQTPNLLSRNQMHYSVMLRGLFGEQM